MKRPKPAARVAQEQQQIDVELSDLENRLERLRVLFDQYFMGIEKREPAIPRKEVERRIQQMRKVRFQTTASRFKFQTMVQRFNTLQQYWNRTCREIENGTYRRHVLKAQRLLATDPPPPPPPQQDTQERAISAADARANAAADLASMLDSDIDLEAEMGNALAALEGPAPAPAKSDVPRGRTSPTLHLGKAPTIKTADSKGLRPGASMSPKPKGLAPLTKRSATGNPLAALGAPRKNEAPDAAPAPKTGGPPPAPSLRPKDPRPASPPAPALAPTGAATQAAARKLAGPAGASSSSSALSQERIKMLHASYVDARRKTNASDVSFEKLEKNIRATEAKLRAQHKGRNVDFDVSIKDGKAILKPRLK